MARKKKSKSKKTGKRGVSKAEFLRRMAAGKKKAAAKRGSKKAGKKARKKTGKKAAAFGRSYDLPKTRRKKARRKTAFKAVAFGRSYDLPKKPRRKKASRRKSASERGFPAKGSYTFGRQGQVTAQSIIKKAKAQAASIWVCVGPKRTGCGGGKKGRRGSRVLAAARITPKMLKKLT